VSEVSNSQVQVVAGQYSDQLWRLNNLYHIINKEGKKVLFKMNGSQERLYHDLWYRIAILKARQRGFTTFLDIFALDTCMWNPNFTAGVIAHNLKDANKIFRTKVKFPYENLEPQIRAMRPIVVDRADEWEFDNGSVISVSTSFRSGTVNFLHVSEMGKIAAKQPEKAVEIVTGAFEAVPLKGMIAVESTAEGRSGKFYDIVTEARKLQDAKKKLTPLDFDFFFEPWWKNSEYKLDATGLVINPRLQKYFEELATKHGIKLTPKQKAWYIAKERTLGGDMKREYPSTPNEAFEASIEGAYFSEQMAKARRDGRITKVPHKDGYLVTTWWDIGRDTTSIWFTQDIGMTVHVIDYYQNAGEGLSHYKKILDERAEEHGYRYGPCMWPHDMGNEDWGTEKTRVQAAQEKGMKGEVLPRMASKEDGIEAGRDFFSVCIFDEQKCSDGLDGLDGYRKQWDERLGTWKDKPLHDWASHPADAFQQLALYHEFTQHEVVTAAKARAVTVNSSKGWT
jgi:hypothetical protein